MAIPTREDLIGAFEAAVAAVEPGDAVRKCLSADEDGIVVDGVRIGQFAPDNITVVGIGKAAAAMAAAACDITGATRATVATPYETDPDPRLIVVNGGHPVPDAVSLQAGAALLEAVGSSGPEDLVIAVVSGGGSAVAEVPAPGVSLRDLQHLNRWLLAAGLSIVDINEIRAAVSGLKAGHLAAATQATIITLVLSDVVGAGPELVASGPTIASSLGTRASEILAGRSDSGNLPYGIRRAIELFEPADVRTGTVSVVGSPATSAKAAADHLSGLGFDTTIVTTSLEGEASITAVDLVRESPRDVVCIATGETTVTVTGIGIGGRNQEAALVAMDQLSRTGGIFAALGTDGIDGITPVAGAIVDSTSRRLATEAGWDLYVELEDNNSSSVLTDIGTVVFTGPTGTNVCDLWMWAIPTTGG